MWRRKRPAADFRAEIQAHIELEAERLREEGVTEEQARRAARRAFGNVTQAEERFHERGRWLWWDHLRQDARFGLHLLARSPGFTVVALLTLGLGIGAVTVIFSAVYAVLLKPLPFTGADRLVAVWKQNPSRGWTNNNISPAEVLEWRDASHVFDGLAAFSETKCVLTGTLGPEEYPCEFASSNLFPLLGVVPLRGRMFSAEDDQPHGRQSAILGYGLWQTRFGGDDRVVGRWIDVNGSSYQVIGVLPASVSHLYAKPEWTQPEMWISGIDLSPTNTFNDDIGIGRLRRGIDLRHASAMMDSVHARLANVHPELAGWGAQLMTLRAQASTDTRAPLIALMAAVIFVLLIACANIANLLLARSASRAGEFAARSVLGAGVGRLVRQLLTESLLLSFGGGLLGIIIATIGCRSLVAIAPAGLVAAAPGLERGPENLRVLAFGMIVILLTTILFGLAPALDAAWRQSATTTLKQSSGSSLRSRGGQRVRNILVITEVALAVVLLVGGGLMTRTLVELTKVKLGFDPSHVLTMRVPLSGPRYVPEEARARFWDQVLERVAALPGVEAASVSRGLPITGWAGQFFTAAEHPNPPAGQVPDANYLVIGPDYFRAMGIPLREGRPFDAHDTHRSRRVAIVNETLARRYWPGENPIGKQLHVGAPWQVSPWLSVVGVAADVHTDGPDESAHSELYLPYPQFPWVLDPHDLVVRTRGSPTAATVVADVVKAVHSVDPDQPVTDIETMDDIVRIATVTQRATMALMLSLAVLALVLAAVGIYSVLSYSVAQQAHEIGLRVALGARHGAVAWLVVGTTLRLALVGIAIGAVAAWPLTAFLKDLLFGVQAGDPITVAAVIGVLIGTSMVAAYLPARRAINANPIDALRSA